MAITNHDRVGKALELLKTGLGPFAEREFKSIHQEKAEAEAATLLGADRHHSDLPITQWDAAALPKLMWDSWQSVFRRTLGQAERSLVSELREHRNRWAHQEAFSGDDAYRALDSAARLLTAVSAPEADEIEKMKMELLRVRFDEQVRSEKRKSTSTTIESAVAGNLKPWREVITPHKDVASGRYQQAEFAADLWQVHLGEGTDEYRDPIEFFRRTFLTESLKRMLTGAIQRISGQGGDPVVQLQTNFGGGKTHSMLALYHLFSGTAPTQAAAHQGIEDRRVKLGCVVPGESPAVFGDALRRLAATATFLYQDGARYWYSTQPTVTKLADDRAEQLRRTPDKVAAELDMRLRENLRRAGDFDRIHPLPGSSADVPDDLDTRLVVLGIEQAFGKESGCPAMIAAKAILETRGSAPRLYRNTLVFLAADKTRLQDLEEALRRHLAWKSVLADQQTLNLSPHQVKQAVQQEESADKTVAARLPETYQWLLVPIQKADPKAPIEWQTIRLSGQDDLAVRASKKLKNDELLITSFAATRLRMELDRIPLWRGESVTIRQLAEDFARYIYLPRLKDPFVLVGAVRSGLGLLTWEKDAFAFADSFDEKAGRYCGLQCGRAIQIQDHEAQGLLVKSDVARRQVESERAATPSSPVGPGQPSVPSPTAGEGGLAADTPAPSPPGVGQPKRFHGSVSLDPTRVGRDASRIADEVITHLAGLMGAEPKVTLEIQVEVPGGVPENVVRTVTENSRTLKFTTHGFEKE